MKSERVTHSSIVATTIVSASFVPVVVGGWKSLNLPVSVPPLPTISVRGEADLSSDRENFVCSRSTLSSHPSSSFAIAAPPFLPHPNIFYLALSGLSHLSCLPLVFLHLRLQRKLVSGLMFSTSISTSNTVNSENGKEVSTRSRHFVTELAHKAVVIES